MLLCDAGACRCPVPFSCPVGVCGCRALMCVPSYLSVREAMCCGCLLALSTLLWCEVVVSCIPLCVMLCSKRSPCGGIVGPKD